MVAADLNLEIIAGRFEQDEFADRLEVEVHAIEACQMRVTEQNARQQFGENPGGGVLMLSRARRPGVLITGPVTVDAR